MMPNTESIIRFFINYIFMVYLFDIINLYNSRYNFGQTRDVLALKESWNDL